MSYYNRLKLKINLFSDIDIFDICAKETLSKQQISLKEWCKKSICENLELKHKLKSSPSLKVFNGL